MVAHYLCKLFRGHAHETSHLQRIEHFGVNVYHISTAQIKKT